MADNGNTVPLIARIGAWILLVIFWTFLASTRIKKPYLPPQQRTPAKQNPAPVRQQQRKPARRKKPTRKTQPDQKETGGTDLASLIPSEQEQQDKENNQIKMFRQSIAAALINENLDSAVSTVYNELQYAQTEEFEAYLEDLAPFVLEVSKLNKKVAEGINNKRLQKVTIVYNGTPREVRIESVHGLTVQTMVKTVLNGKEVDKGVMFQVTDLEAEERLKWLPTPHKPSDYAMKFILLWKAGDYEAAAEIAGKCGIMAKEFKGLIDPKV